MTDQGFGFPAPLPADSGWRRWGLPGSWRTFDPMPCFNDSGGLTMPGHFDISDVAFPLHVQGRRPQKVIWSSSHSLRSRCLRFTPSVTLEAQDSLPAGGHPWPGGTLTRKVRSEGFQDSAVISDSRHLFPLPQASPGAHVAPESVIRSLVSPRRSDPRRSRRS